MYIFHLSSIALKSNYTSTGARRARGPDTQKMVEKLQMLFFIIYSLPQRVSFLIMVSSTIFFYFNHFQTIFLIDTVQNKCIYFSINIWTWKFVLLRDKKIEVCLNLALIGFDNLFPAKPGAMLISNLSYVHQKKCLSKIS